MRVRYLNYISFYKKIEITLSNPEDLVSVSLQYVKILNMRQCVNIKNLASKQNTYTNEEIFQLSNLKRIYSCDDRYDNEGNSLLEDILKDKSLEHVHIFNYRLNSNIVNSMTLSENISTLRYLDIYQSDITCKIELDVTAYFPEYMSVYRIMTGCDGTVAGP